MKGLSPSTLLAHLTPTLHCAPTTVLSLSIVSSPDHLEQLQKVCEEKDLVEF